jgi:uncharacterized protein YqgV (UPF0045/DUF77 family)
MTSKGEMNVVPIETGRMSGELAKAIDALEEFDTPTRSLPMGTIR